MRRALFVAALIVAAGGVAAAVRWATETPNGPEPIAWDSEACAACGMHVGEPAFAAQIQQPGGHTLDFDDPGCLLEYELDRHPDESAVWFHDSRSDRWLSSHDVAFVTVARTPMGHRLGAVAKGTPDAISVDAARARVDAARRERRP